MRPFKQYDKHFTTHYEVRLDANWSPCLGHRNGQVANNPTLARSIPGSRLTNVTASGLEPGKLANHSTQTDLAQTCLRLVAYPLKAEAGLRPRRGGQVYSMHIVIRHADVVACWRKSRTHDNSPAVLIWFLRGPEKTSPHLMCGDIFVSQIPPHPTMYHSEL